MSVREYLDAAAAVLVEEFQRMNLGLVDALEKARTWMSGGERAEPEIDPPVTAGGNNDVAAQNDVALAELQRMMGAFGGMGLN